MFPPELLKLRIAGEDEEPEGEPAMPPPDTEERFRLRIRAYERAGTPTYIHHFWWVVHNAVAHPALAFFPGWATFRFHDYTSDKINLTTADDDAP